MVWAASVNRSSRFSTAFCTLGPKPKSPDMTFEIPIDREVSIAQYTLRLKMTFKKNIGKSSMNVLGAGVILLFASFMISDKKSPGYFFLSLGLFYLFNALHFFWYYSKTSRRLKKVYHDMVILREEHKDTTTWRFEPDGFGYKDMYYDYSIKWEAFKGYRVVEKNLFLQLRESIDQSFIIGELEIGKQPFSDVVAFVDERLKNLED
jgi:hypothetical protein